MDFLQWLGPSALIGLIGAVVKFSFDYSRVKTLTDGQQKEIDQQRADAQKAIEQNKAEYQREIARLEKQIETNQAANKEQHEVFYQNQRDTLELKVMMGHVQSTLDRLVKMVEALERRRDARND
jgi:cytochrome c biogenesis factor